MKSALDIRRKLNNKIAESSKKHSVKLGDIMNPDFISSCSQYSDFDELLKASRFKVESKADFAAIPESEWERFIQENTSYKGWIEMQEAASITYKQKAVK